MPGDKIKLKILTAKGIVEEGEYDKVVAPGCVGEFGVLPGHISFATPLDVGVLRAGRAVGEEDESQQDSTFAIHGGFCEVQDDNVLVLAVAAEPREKIDPDRAKRAEERARERLSERSREDIDFDRAEIALKRAIMRLEVHSGEFD